MPKQLSPGVPGPKLPNKAHQEKESLGEGFFISFWVIHMLADDNAAGQSSAHDLF